MSSYYHSQSGKTFFVGGGIPGRSAYQEAVHLGIFSGSPEEFLIWLQGSAGPQGDPGAGGSPGPAGPPGPPLRFIAPVATDDDLPGDAIDGDAVLVEAAGEVRVRQGGAWSQPILWVGPQGPAGPDGPAGPVGRPPRFLAPIDDVESLPAEAEDGDLVLVAASGAVWVRQGGEWAWEIPWVGPDGPQGDPGPQGSAGPPVRFLEPVADEESLPAEADEGDAVFVEATGEVRVRRGGDWGLVMPWVGPPGGEGPPGPPGETGPAGPAGGVSAEAVAEIVNTLPVSPATAHALSGLAPIADPEFTGSVRVPGGPGIMRAEPDGTVGRSIGVLLPWATCLDVVTGVALDPATRFDGVGAAVERNMRSPTAVSAVEGVARMPWPSEDDPDVTALMSIAVDGSEGSIEIAFPEPEDADVMAAYAAGPIAAGFVVGHAGDGGAVEIDLAAVAPGLLAVSWAPGLGAVVLNRGDWLFVPVAFLGGVGVAERQALHRARRAPISLVAEKVAAGSSLTATAEDILPTDVAVRVGLVATALTPVPGLPAGYTHLAGGGFTAGNYQAVAAERNYTIGWRTADVTGAFAPGSSSNAGVSQAVVLRGAAPEPVAVASANGVGTQVVWPSLADLPPGSAVLAMVSVQDPAPVGPAGATLYCARFSTQSAAIAVALDVSGVYAPAPTDLADASKWAATLIAFAPEML